MNSTCSEPGDDTRTVPQVNDDDASQENLEKGTRNANSNLRLLIEAVGVLLLASADLLERLQQILGAHQSTVGDTSVTGEAGTSPPPPDYRGR